jgi:3-hydroxybutyrate dehydrogenase
MSLAGRTALVTGGASGIGAACARKLAEAGAHVIVADRDAAGAERLAAEIGGEAWEVDLADTAALAQTQVTADILVNNAGFQHVSPLPEFPPEVFGRMLRVMVEAPFLLVRASLPRMYEQGWGRVVNISSVHGLRASEFKGGYVAAKHALEGLSKTIALEGASHGVTSNTICPGYVRTPLVQQQIAAQARVHGIPEDEVVSRVMLRESAIKRLIEPEEVAELALFLCGPASSFATGTSFVMDGGWTARLSGDRRDDSGYRCRIEHQRVVVHVWHQSRAQHRRPLLPVLDEFRRLHAGRLAEHPGWCRQQRYRAGQSGERGSDPVRIQQQVPAVFPDCFLDRP